MDKQKIKSVPRLTTDNPVDNFQTALNFTDVSEDGWVWLRQPEMALTEYARQLVKGHGSSIDLDCPAGNVFEGEVIVNVSDDTLVLDGENGYPMELKDLQAGETVYVYIGPAMAMSRRQPARLSLVRSRQMQRHRSTLR